MSESTIQGTAAPMPMRTEVRTQSDDLMAVAREFESLLLNQIMKSMRESVPKTEIFGEGQQVQMYEELRDEELSKVLAEKGGLGIAELLVESLRKSDSNALRELQELQKDSNLATRAYEATSSLSIPGND